MFDVTRVEGDGCLLSFAECPVFGMYDLKLADNPDFGVLHGSLSDKPINLAQPVTASETAGLEGSNPPGS